MTDQPATTGSGNAETAREAATFMPAADIVETQDAVLMLLDVPGAEPDSLSVALEKQELRVSARSTSSAPPGYTLMHAEYRDGNYERAFTLGAGRRRAHRGDLQGRRPAPDPAQGRPVAGEEDRSQGGLRGG